MGDTIRYVAGRKIKTSKDIAFALASFRPGDSTSVVVRRGSDVMSLSVELGGAPITSNRSLPDAQIKSGNLVRAAENPTVIQSKVYSGIARVIVNGTQVGYGIVVHESGLILAKASICIGDPKNILRIRLSDGTSHAARIRAYNESRDLVLLSVAADGLSSVVFSDAEIAQGSFVITAGPSVPPLGNVSLSEVHSGPSSECGYLGALCQLLVSGEDKFLAIVGVAKDGPIASAGIKAGDVIVAVDGLPITSHLAFLRSIEQRAPKTQVKLTIIDEAGSTVDKLVTLSACPISTQWDDSMRLIRGVASKRSDGFGDVIQHDARLGVDECGSPLLDQQGNVIGMNISRYDRATCFALSGKTLNSIVPRMIESAQEMRKLEPDAVAQ